VGDWSWTIGDCDESYYNTHPNIDSLNIGHTIEGDYTRSELDTPLHPIRADSTGFERLLN
jgi:hypothetical protein